MKREKLAPIWEIVKQIDAILGINSFKNPNEKKTPREYFLTLTIPRQAFLFGFSTISTLIITNFSLMTIIIGFSLSSSIYSLHFCTILVVFNENNLKDILKWCERLYDIEEKFHKAVQEIAITHMETTEKWVVKFLKWLNIVLYGDAIVLTLGFVVIGIFLPNDILPKFSLPIPWYLPFKNQNTWLAFLTTVLAQTLMAVDTASVAIFLYGIGFSTLKHIMTYLDIINDVVKKMKEDMELDPISSIKISFTSFEEYVKIISEMISDVNFILIKYAKFWSLAFLTNELGSFGSLFICGLFLTVIHEQYFFALGITVVCALLFFVCYCNEIILDKFNDINEALYDVPWYEMSPKQRKTLMILMHCDKIQKGLNAANIHSLTLERFRMILKTGYTSMLILKDIVQN